MKKVFYLAAFHIITSISGCDGLRRQSEIRSSSETSDSNEKQSTEKPIARNEVISKLLEAAGSMLKYYSDGTTVPEAARLKPSPDLPEENPFKTHFWYPGYPVDTSVMYYYYSDGHTIYYYNTKPNGATYTVDPNVYHYYMTSTPYYPTYKKNSGPTSPPRKHERINPQTPSWETYYPYKKKQSPQPNYPLYPSYGNQQPPRFTPPAYGSPYGNQQPPRYTPPEYGPPDDYPSDGNQQPPRFTPPAYGPPDDYQREYKPPEYKDAGRDEDYQNSLKEPPKPLNDRPPDYVAIRVGLQISEVPNKVPDLYVSPQVDNTSKKQRYVVGNFGYK